MRFAKKPQKSLHSIKKRINYQRSHTVWRSQYTAFINEVSSLDLPAESNCLSVSCGDGMWDFLAFSNNVNIKKIIATDIVDCPVKKEDIKLLNSNNNSWSFQKIKKDTKLPFENESFNLVFHQDVIEHTSKPDLLLSENYRVLKPGGYLLFGTPNIYRPANILKMLTGRLKFPYKLDDSKELGPVIHIQEFDEQQLLNMVKKKGFAIQSIRNCFWGISFLKLNFKDFPNNKYFKKLCQYIFITAQKPTHQ